MSPNLRVLYVDYSLGFGGAVKSLGLSLRALPLVEKFILTSQDPELIEAWFPGLPVVGFRRTINYRTRAKVQSRLKQRTLQRAALLMLAAADLVVTLKNYIRLLAFLQRKKIDIIHLNNGFVPLEALLAARSARVPCVVHLRDFQDDMKVLELPAARNVAKVITVSNAVGASLDQSPIPPAVRTTIYDPVDLELMDNATVDRDRIRDALALAKDDIAVGIFGRVIPWKGQLEFVRALLPAMRGNSRIRAVIVGDESDGDEAYFGRVREIIEESEFSTWFVMAGYQRSVEGYYAAMDIVVHASVTPEPFGMVVPEAMAAGRAVIAADAGGPREVVDHGVDGLLTPPGDIEALSRAVLLLASDNALRDRMGAAGKAKALARFGISTQAARIAAVYEHVVAPRRRRE